MFLDQFLAVKNMPRISPHATTHVHVPCDSCAHGFCTLCVILIHVTCMHPVLFLCVLLV